MSDALSLQQLDPERPPSSYHQLFLSQMLVVRVHGDIHVQYTYCTKAGTKLMLIILFEESSEKLLYYVSNYCASSVVNASSG